MTDHDPPEPRSGTTDRAVLAARFDAVRGETLRRVASLTAEDMVVQSMPDASPAKWHLAHTTWFFEVMVLAVHDRSHQPLDAGWHTLFNSYYESLGPRHPRPLRGLLTRPALAEVMRYRAHVDAAVRRLLDRADAATFDRAAGTIELGLQHEQQHQELIYTDLLHLLSHNPHRGGCAADAPVPGPGGSDGWLAVTGGDHRIGHRGGGFAFDNEGPSHPVTLAPFALARRLVTNGEYLAFMRDGGYRRASLWLSDGWAQVQAQGWVAPAYWHLDGGQPGQRFSLRGLVPWSEHEPVCHLSFFEAAAFAEWAGARLPTEFEWEAAVRSAPPGALAQLDDTAWQWTRSSYDPYPRFRPWRGAAGEYNGKFMVGQLVLRGGSLATPAGHCRPSYRNFFPPAARWQFSGLRLARDD